MMRGLDKVLQTMPAIVAFCMVLKPRWSTLPLAVWLLVVVGVELTRAIQGNRGWEPKPLPVAFRWFATGSIAIYALMMMGLAWTENEVAGWFALEVKFSLLLIPLLMLYHWHRHGAKGLTAVPRALAAGLILFMSWRMLLACVSGDAQLWRYAGLAGPFHPTYMGLYLVLMPLLLRAQTKGYGLILIISGVFVGLLASKAAWIVAGLLWGSMLVVRAMRRGARFWGIGAALVSMCLGGWMGDGGRWSEFTQYVSTEVLSTEESRAGEAVEPYAPKHKPVKTGSSAGRMQAWNASVEVLFNSPFGVGTGDVTDVLCEVYEQKGSSYALRKRMNPHSAWLQLGVSHGWGGAALMLLWWFGTAAFAYQFRNPLLLTWITALILHGSIESLLELQQGIVPTVLLGCVFALSGSPRSQHQEN